MKILIKLPSRGRPSDLIKAINSIWDNVADVDNVMLSLTLDLDDETMHNKGMVEILTKYPNTSIQWGLSDSKVHAVNRDLPMDWWDILVIMSDDFRFTMWGFDIVIRQPFEDGNYDKLVHLPERDSGKALATMYIAGREFYNRFSYVYNPVYRSLFCDNEIMEISQQLNKYYYLDYPGVIEHLNPAYGHGSKDALFLYQQEIGWSLDQKTYNERKNRNFDIHLLNL